MTYLLDFVFDAAIIRFVVFVFTFVGISRINAHLRTSCAKSTSTLSCGSTLLVLQRVIPDGLGLHTSLQLLEFVVAWNHFKSQ